MTSLAISTFPAYPYTVEEVISPGANYSGKNASLLEVKQALRGLDRYFDKFCRDVPERAAGRDLGRTIDLAQ